MSDNILTVLVVAALILVGLVGVVSSPIRVEKTANDLTHSIPEFQQ